MRILITGICGFVGSSLAEHLLERIEGLSVAGIDNLMREGSEGNRLRLRKLGINVIHGDIRSSSDCESLPAADWVVDAAANPSVLAGIPGSCSSRQLLEHNLTAVINVLEYCKTRKAGLLLLSSSRVYSIPALCSLPLKTVGNAFQLDETQPLPQGVSRSGIGVDFSTLPPVSLYGSTKIASETVALEYGYAFDFPVWIDRCGVLAGPGQFGTSSQGIFSYWIHAHRAQRPLHYLGFDGTGKQVRDIFHPGDLASLIHAQVSSGRSGGRRLYTAGGGVSSALSLAQLTAWCDARFRPHVPQADLRPRPYDIPWLIMDSADASQDFNWSTKVPIAEILEEIARHAELHADWLERSGM